MQKEPSGDDVDVSKARDGTVMKRVLKAATREMLPPRGAEGVGEPVAAPPDLSRWVHCSAGIACEPSTACHVIQAAHARTHHHAP